MNLYFLPEDMRRALYNLNLNYLTEIRLRTGQPVIIQYKGEYRYINKFGATADGGDAIVCGSAEKVLYAAMEKSVYSYSEQLKNGFITVDGGVRVGIAGEYVTQNGEIITVKNITSLNIRIPHDIFGVANEIYDRVYTHGLKNTLIFSPPGFGKTTLLRDIVRNISKERDKNILIFDERSEISAFDGEGKGFDLGGTCDVVRGSDKLTAVVNAIRVMRPQVIVTDELYGSGDHAAVAYARECGVCVFASTHSTDENVLKSMPFEIYIKLTGIGKEAVVYDKNFDIVCNCATFGRVGAGGFSRKEA